MAVELPSGSRKTANQTDWLELNVSNLEITHEQNENDITDNLIQICMVYVSSMIQMTAY